MKLLKEIYDYRYMISSLVSRELRGRYKGSVLGFLWTFLNPLLQMLVYSIVFSIVMRMGIDKYYLFLFVALIPWIFFSTAMTAGSTSVLSQGALVSKIYFPREVLPIAFVTTCFINMLYCFIVVFAVLFISGIPINPLALLCLIPVMIIEYIFALGIAFISSSVTVYFRDSEHILGIVAMAWQWFTPVIYPLERVPEEYQKWFMLNPMTPIITVYRDILYYSRIPKLQTLIHATIAGVVILLIGMLIFRKLKKHFAEEF
jgi:ABC-2 type transport system permease protein